MEPKKTISLSKLKIDIGIKMPDVANVEFASIDFEGMEAGKEHSTLWQHSDPETKLAKLKKFLSKKNDEMRDKAFVPFVEGKGIRVFCVTREVLAMIPKRGGGPRKKAAVPPTVRADRAAHPTRPDSGKGSRGKRGSYKPRKKTPIKKK